MPIDFNALLPQIDKMAPVEHCEECGGYIGDYGPRYARHNDECECSHNRHNDECQRTLCLSCKGLCGDRAGICPTCNGSGHETEED